MIPFVRQPGPGLLALGTIMSLLPAASTSAIDLDSLLVRSVGGQPAVEQLREVSTIYGSGSIVLNGMPGTFELYLALPGQIFTQMDFGEYTIAQAYDGQTAWQRDHNGMVSELSGFEKRSLLNQAYFQTYSYLFDNRLPGECEYMGTEERDGQIFHKVAFYPLNQDTIFSYFDPGTGHQQYDVTMLDNLELITEYAGHRLYQHVIVAFQSRATAPAAGISAEVTIDTIVFNADFDPAIFHRPQAEIDYRFANEVDSVLIPFRYLDGHIYIMAGVNGRKLAFILDSGASSNVFDRWVAKELGLPVVGQVAAVGVAGYQAIDLVKTDSVTIGELVLLNQVGGTLDLRAISGNWSGELPFGGVLGYDFLSRFPVLVDYASGQLTIYNPLQFEPPPGGHEIGFELVMQVPTIKAELIGLPGRFLVDLGNAFSLIVHHDFSRQYDLENRLNDVRDLPRAIGGIGGEVGGKSAYAATFAFGDIRIADLPVLLPENSDGLAGSGELAGNIGNLLLQQFRVLFDYSGQRLVFYEPAMNNE